MRSALAIVAVASLLASGCVKGTAQETTEAHSEIPPTAAPAAITDDKGGVQGTVVDPELGVIQGALVGLGGTEFQTTSAQDGRFSLSLVPPGTYDLFAGKLGYESAAKKVEVVAGAVATVQMTLTPMAVQEAYTRMMHNKGLLACAVAIKGVIGVAACGAPVINTTLSDRFLLLWDLKEATAPWVGAVFETSWKSSQALGNGLNPIWEIEPCYNDNDVTFAEGSGHSPKVFRVDEEKIRTVLKNERDGKGCNPKTNCDEKHCLVVSRMFGAAETTGQTVDVGITWQQTYENFFTAFFFDPAPDPYTAIPS